VEGLFWDLLLIIIGVVTIYVIIIGPGCIELGIILLIIRNRRGQDQAHIPNWLPYTFIVVGICNSIAVGVSILLFGVNIVIQIMNN
jgi:hypothetical protein